MIERRTFLTMSCVVGLCAARSLKPAQAQPPSNKTLLTAPMELGGEWGDSPRRTAKQVLVRVREVCLSGIELVSDQQPLKLRIDNHTQGTPAIQLHDEEPSTAWIIVNIGGRSWAQLAYQFGHELGHVFCNSWPRGAKPAPPTQWLEEALVEAFSIRGLGLLAASWENKPPFAGDEKFAAAIRNYRQNLVEEYKKATEPNIASWLAIRRAAPESRGDKEPSAVLPILAILEKDQACVADLGAANRWPERTRVPIEEYLTKWEKSCTELGAPKRLPGQVRDFLKLGRAL